MSKSSRSKKYRQIERAETQRRQQTEKAQIPVAEVVPQVVRQIRAEMFAGPLPPQDVLKRYNDVLPGAAERILTMAEDQGSHRRGLENRVIDNDISSSKRGSWFAFIIGITAVVGSIVLLAMDKNIAGFVTLITALGTLLGVFIHASRQRKKERLQKYGRDVS